MIYAKLFRDIPLNARFVDRYTDGSYLVYRKVSKGKALLTDMQSSNNAFLSIHHVGDIKRIAYNDAFPLYDDVIREAPSSMCEVTA